MVMGKDMENRGAARKSMKRLCTLVVVLILMTSAVSAVSSTGIYEPGTGIEMLAALVGSNETGQGSGQGQQSGQNETGQGTGQGQQEQVEQETENRGENITIQIQQREEVRARNLSELREMIAQRQQEMNQELQALKEQQQQVYQNQNRVRLAVHSLLAMEDLVGGIGPQVSEIAREFNNSVQATIRAEERIQSRNRVIRFFAGGDEGAAQEIEEQVVQNRERIQQLQQLALQCECEEEVRALLQEDIENMEQEQTRLQQLAQNEKKVKGLFGWLWK